MLCIPDLARQVTSDKLHYTTRVPAMTGMRSQGNSAASLSYRAISNAVQFQVGHSWTCCLNRIDSITVLPRLYHMYKACLFVHTHSEWHPLPLLGGGCGGAGGAEPHAGREQQPAGSVLTHVAPVLMALQLTLHSQGGMGPESLGLSNAENVVRFT